MISLLATVLNEDQNIHRLMHTIQRQTRLPDEIIIVDGGSQDNTVTILRSYEHQLPLRVIVEPGCNISRGRNIAIQAARGDILAFTDAGVRLEDDWLERITQPLLDNPALTVSAGFFKADPHTLFEVALGATTLPLADEIQPETFLPSSRSVAVRKTAAEQAGGYPEWLDFCEDLIFDLRLKKTQPPFVFVPDAVAHFQPRPTLKAFFKQYYRYARGDGKADLWRKRHAIRYATYLIGVPMIVLLAALVHPLCLGLLIPGAIVYLYQPYRRLSVVMRAVPEKSPTAWLYVTGLIPVLRVVGDVAKMAGYPAGRWWRIRHRPPDWRRV